MKRLTIAFLCFALILLTLLPTPVKALGEPVVEVGPNLKVNAAAAVAAGASAQANTSLQFKELTLDGIAFAIADKLLRQMTGSVINWINSGFQGSPAFVGNLDKFLLGVADEVAGEFIYGSELGFLCEPIEFQVRVALQIQYLQSGRDTYEPKCTLSDVIGNVENFLSGNFSSGGWPAFFELTVGAHNDPNKAFFSAASELEARIEYKQNNETKVLDFGRGLFSFKVCDSAEDSNGQPRKDCTITTPGAAIERALTFKVGEEGSLALIQADEFNEIISALLGQLTNQALVGANGLLGLGGSSRYSNNVFGDSGNQSYLAALATEDITGDQVIGYNPVTEAIKNEGEYASIQEEILSMIGEVEDKLEKGEEDYPGCWDLDLNTTLTNIKEDAEENLEITEETLTTLETINGILQSTTNGQARLEVLNAYTELEQRGILTTPVEIQELRIVFLDEDLPEIISAFEDHIDNERKRCGFNS